MGVYHVDGNCILFCAAETMEGCYTKKVLIVLIVATLFITGFLFFCFDCGFRVLRAQGVVISNNDARPLNRDRISG